MNTEKDQHNIDIIEARAMEKEVICDKCEKGFPIPDKLKQKRIEKVDVSYFECPHCEAKYITHCMDKRIKEGIRRGWNPRTLKRASDRLADKMKHKLK